jgi:hypothetical protein
MDELKACKWAFYKGLWHLECNSFLTTTMYGELNYTFEEIPESYTCPNCAKKIEIIDRQFGRKEPKQ